MSKLRDEITALKHTRDYHQIDEPEYVDRVLALFEKTCKQIINETHEIYLTHEDVVFGDSGDSVVRNWDALREKQRQKLQALLAEGEVA